MRGRSVQALGPVGFTLFWLGVSVAVVCVVGLVAGLARDDVAGTFGRVVWLGLTIASVLIVLAVLIRREKPRDGRPPEA